MLERDSALQAGYGHCGGRIKNCRSSLEQIRHTLGRGRCPRQRIAEFTHLTQGAVHSTQIGTEEQQITNAYISQHDQYAAYRQCCQITRVGHQTHDRWQARLETSGNCTEVQCFLSMLLILLLSVRLHAKCLHHADAPQVFLDHRVGVALARSEEHTSELQSHLNLVCRLLLE